MNFVPMALRRAAVLAALTLAATACGGSGGGSSGGGGGGGPEDGPSASGGAATPRTDVQLFDRRDTQVEVEEGARFALKLDDNPSTGYAWIIDDPRFDETVVTAEGDDYEPDKPVTEGSGGKRLLAFRAQSPGSTAIELLYCFRCGTEYEETDDATELTFTVTVRAEDES